MVEGEKEAGVEQVEQTGAQRLALELYHQDRDFSEVQIGRLAVRISHWNTSGMLRPGTQFESHKRYGLAKMIEFHVARLETAYADLYPTNNNSVLSDMNDVLKGTIAKGEHGSLGNLNSEARSALGRLACADLYLRIRGAGRFDEALAIEIVARYEAFILSQFAEAGDAQVIINLYNADSVDLDKLASLDEETLIRAARLFYLASEVVSWDVRARRISSLLMRFIPNG